MLVWENQHGYTGQLVELGHGIMQNEIGNLGW